MKVLVANPPWPGPGYGARSDVRWPHKRSDKYIEYPIYLSYTVAVVEEAGFEVSFIDAIMDELSIEEFAQQVHDLDPRLALIETSTPSIDFDLETAAAIKQAVARRPLWRCWAPTSPTLTRRWWPRTRPWMLSSGASSSTPPPTWPVLCRHGGDLAGRCRA